jgi:DEAD/DEAH box helicase domain-containing protein
MDRIDILDDIELMVRDRVSLSRLAEANLGVKKERHGSEAIALYRDGKMDELKAYCLNDVKLTKELYDLMRKQNYLMVPDKRTGKLIKVGFARNEIHEANLS